jgi:hypothetical protein
MTTDPTELALRFAFTNPAAALAIVDRLLLERAKVGIREMSDQELAFLGECVEEGREFDDEARSIASGLADRRKHGEFAVSREEQLERRQAEGSWFFVRCLRLLANHHHNLPIPDYCHGLNEYRELVARELLESYGWGPGSAGVLLDDWDPDDRAAMLEVFARVNVAAPRSITLARSQPGGSLGTL